MMKLGDSSRRLEYVKVDQIDGRRYKIEIWRKDERDGRLKLIMRLKKDEGAQSHRAENSAVTFTEHPSQPYVSESWRWRSTSDASHYWLARSLTVQTLAIWRGTLVGA